MVEFIASYIAVSVVMYLAVQVGEKYNSANRIRDFQEIVPNIRIQFVTAAEVARAPADEKGIGFGRVAKTPIANC